MIATHCFTKDWQNAKRQELGGCDPVLLEKTIHAFALLDALSAQGLPFVFKRGTSLLLRVPHIRRLSIDADIYFQEPPEKLNPLLDGISRTKPFIRMTEDDRGEHRVPARRHFKFFYTPLDPNNPAPFVLLDVVHERNVYGAEFPEPLDVAARVWLTGMRWRWCSGG
jgi:Nucleotidyl transferase AbiEii toxin, Type IV TA system